MREDSVRPAERLRLAPSARRGAAPSCSPFFRNRCCRSPDFFDRDLDCCMCHRAHISKRSLATEHCCFWGEVAGKPLKNSRWAARGDAPLNRLPPVLKILEPQRSSRQTLFERHSSSLAGPSFCSHSPALSALCELCSLSLVLMSSRSPSLLRQNF